MALNLDVSSAQMQELMRQSAAAAHTALLLTRYRKELGAAWAGEECGYMDLVIDDLTQVCKKLSMDAESAGRDMFRAMEDILAEEAEGILI